MSSELVKWRTTGAKVICLHHYMINDLISGRWSVIAYLRMFNVLTNRCAKLSFTKKNSISVCNRLSFSIWTYETNEIEYSILIEYWLSSISCKWALKKCRLMIFSCWLYIFLRNFSFNIWLNSTQSAAIAAVMPIRSVWLDFRDVFFAIFTHHQVYQLQSVWSRDHSFFFRVFNLSHSHFYVFLLFICLFCMCCVWSSQNNLL